MLNQLGTSGRKLAKAGIYVQIIVSSMLALLSVLVFPDALKSIFIGCMSYVIPHSIFAYWVFRYVGATKNSLVAQSFSQGMKIKMALTVIIFAVAFSQFDAHPLPLLGAYVAVMLSQWLAMLALRRMS